MDPLHIGDQSYVVSFQLLVFRRDIFWYAISNSLGFLVKILVSHHRDRHIVIAYFQLMLFFLVEILVEILLDYLRDFLMNEFLCWTYKVGTNAKPTSVVLEQKKNGNLAIGDPERRGPKLEVLLR